MFAMCHYINMKSSFYLLLFSILLSACNNEPPKGEFTTDELSWLVYAEKSEAVFSDTASKKKETLKVVFRTELNQIKQYYPIEAEVALSNIDTMKSFRIYLLKDQNGFKKYLRIGEVYRSLDIVKPKPEFKIGNTVYKNVYEITEDTTKHKMPIWKVWYNRDKGILQYTNIQNETFSLVE